MTNARRGRGSRHGVYLCAVAALGLALSGCGGSVGRSAAAASAAAGTQPADSAVASQSAATAQSSAGEDSTPAQGTSSVATTGSGLTGGTVTINWQPPTENVDGTALTNLAGYHIHYGVSSGNYTRTISVSNPGIATYVVSNLTPGTYYFAVAAVNSAGTESPLSSEVSATVTN